MAQLLSPPDRYLARCGRLECSLHERRIPGAPSFMRGLRALLVSDTHVLRRTRPEDLRALANQCAGLEPDLLLLGGDYADRSADAARLFEAFKGLSPRLGGYGVVGNNDVEAWDDLDGLRRTMDAAGYRLLVNEAVKLPINGGTLYLGGVDERKFGTPVARGLFPGRPAPNRYRVLLSHYPCMPDAVPDLMLSGHTHGGQFNLLGITPFTVGFERLFRRDIRSLAVAGLHEIGGMRLLVSKGIGASRIQWRVGVRPEIDLLLF